MPSMIDPPQRWKRLEGVSYTEADVRSAHGELAEIRNAALEQNAFPEAVLMSHVLAYLAEYADILHDDER